MLNVRHGSDQEMVVEMAVVRILNGDEPKRILVLPRNSNPAGLMAETLAALAKLNYRPDLYLGFRGGDAASRQYAEALQAMTGLTVVEFNPDEHLAFDAVLGEVGPVGAVGHLHSVWKVNAPVAWAFVSKEFGEEWGASEARVHGVTIDVVNTQPQILLFPATGSEEEISSLAERMCRNGNAASWLLYDPDIKEKSALFVKDETLRAMQQHLVELRALTGEAARSGIVAISSDDLAA